MMIITTVHYYKARPCLFVVSTLLFTEHDSLVVYLKAWLD